MGRRGYPPEFRRKVLDLLDAERTVADVARDLGISQQSIYVWRRRTASTAAWSQVLPAWRRRSSARRSGGSPNWKPSWRLPAERWSCCGRRRPQKAVLGRSR